MATSTSKRAPATRNYGHIRQSPHLGTQPTAAVPLCSPSTPTEPGVPTSTSVCQTTINCKQTATSASPIPGAPGYPAATASTAAHVPTRACDTTVATKGLIPTYDQGPINRHGANQLHLGRTHPAYGNTSNATLAHQVAKVPSILRRQQAARHARTQTGAQTWLSILVALTLVNPSQSAMQHQTPDTHLTIFEDLGEMVPESAYVHVLIPVDTTNFTNLFAAAQQLLVSNLNTYRKTQTFKNSMWYRSSYDRMSHLTIHPEHGATNTKDAGISILHQIQENQRALDNIIYMLPQESDNNHLSRQKRVIPYLIGLAAAAIIGAIIGTYFGPYNQAQFDSLPLLQNMNMLLHTDEHHHHMLDGLTQRVNNAYKVLKENEADYKDFDNHITIWSAIIRHLDHRRQQFLDFVTQLQHCRLSLTWLSAYQMQQIHQSVIQQANKHNLIPLSEHLTDYFQMDVSYIRKGTFITAIVHVHVTSSSSSFKVYRSIPFPIPIDNNKIMTIQAQQDIIAVGRNNHHRVLTQTQLSSYRKHYQKFLCEQPLITNTNFSTTCVGSLMDHNPLGIQEHCSLTSSPSQESVFQINHNQFAVYSPETFTGRGHCTNGTNLSALISTTTTVTVPPGCTFNLRHHILSVPINAITTSEPWVQETKWDTMEVPKQLLRNSIIRDSAIHQLLAHDEVIKQAAQRHLNASAILLNATHASIAHDIIRAQQTAHLHQWLIIALAIISALILFIVCSCMCRRYRQATTFTPYIAAMTAPSAATIK